MLTKTDLKQLRNVVHEEVDVIVDEKLEPVKKDLAGLKTDVSGLKQDVGGLKQDVGGLKQDMKYLKRKVNRIDKTVDLIVTNYDEADVKLQRRVGKIESHLALEV